MNLFLLAAGLGTRLLPYTLQHPKPAIPFLNVPMGLFQFQYIRNISVPLSSFTVNTHHLPLQIEHLYRTQPYLKMQPLFSHEPTILGSAGAIKKAKGLMKEQEPILLMNADEVYFTKNEEFLNDALVEHNRNGALATLIVMKHPEAGKKFGAIWCDGTEIKHIGKTSNDPNLIPWHYIGACILSWDIMNHIVEDKEQNIFYDILIKDLHRVQMFPIQAEWYETGNKDDLLKATAEVLNNMNEHQNLLQFINEYDASKIIRTEKTLSLVSKEQKINPEELLGVNCISKSAIVPAHIDNCIAFEHQTIR